MIRKSVGLFLAGLASVFVGVFFSALVAAVFWLLNHTVGIVVFAIAFCISTGVSLERYGQMEVARHFGKVTGTGREIEGLAKRP